MNEQHDLTPTAALSPRAHELSMLAREDPTNHDDGWRIAFSELLADAVLDADAESLTAVIDTNRQLLAEGRNMSCALEVFTEVVHTFGQRLRDVEEVDRMEPGSLPERVLVSLVGGPAASASLRRLANDDRTSLSRACSRLKKSGLVFEQKAGREKTWRLTPRGTALANRLTARSRFKELAARPSGDWVPLPPKVMDEVNAAWFASGSTEALSVVSHPATGGTALLRFGGAELVTEDGQEFRFVIHGEDGERVSGYKVR